MKTSLLKWKADYDIAADEYNKAGMDMELLFGILVYIKNFGDLL
jgi:hypothetical protein